MQFIILRRSTLEQLGCKDIKVVIIMWLLERKLYWHHLEIAVKI